MEMTQLTLTDQNFQEQVLENDVPVLVDFWAPWCQPCLIVAPIIAEIAREFEGKIKVGKLNVDEARNIAMRYNIMSIPTLVIFKNGKEGFGFVGVQPKHIIIEKIKSIL